MCKICDDDYSLPTEPSGFYFAVDMHPDWNCDCPYDTEVHLSQNDCPIVYLTPTYYYDCQECLFDMHIDTLDLEKYGLHEVSECTCATDGSSIVDIYSRLITYGFTYNQDFVDHFGVFNNPQDRVDVMQILMSKLSIQAKNN